MCMYYKKCQGIHSIDCSNETGLTNRGIITFSLNRFYMAYVGYILSSLPFFFTPSLYTCFYLRGDKRRGQGVVLSHLETARNTVSRFVRRLKRKVKERRLADHCNRGCDTRNTRGREHACARASGSGWRTDMREGQRGAGDGGRGGGARAGAEGRLARVGRVVGSASCSLTGRRRERLTLVAC